LYGRIIIFSVQALGICGLVHALPKLQIPVSFTLENIVTDAQQSITTPKLKMLCPVDFKDAKTPKEGIYGLERITRHPGLWSLGLASAGVALYTPFWSEIILFGFPLIFAGIGGAHQDMRFRRNGGLTESTDNVTSLFPFVALLQGKQNWVDLSSELKWVNIGLGVITAFTFAVRREMKLNQLLKKL
jgi:hypothetical protein